MRVRSAEIDDREEAARQAQDKMVAAQRKTTDQARQGKLDRERQRREDETETQHELESVRSEHGSSHTLKHGVTQQQITTTEVVTETHIVSTPAQSVQWLQTITPSAPIADVTVTYTANPAPEPIIAAHKPAGPLIVLRPTATAIDGNGSSSATVTNIDDRPTHKLSASASVLDPVVVLAPAVATPAAAEAEEESDGGVAAAGDEPQRNSGHGSSAGGGRAGQQHGGE